MILRIFFSVMAFVVVNINGRTEKFSQFYTERTFEIDSLKNLGNSNKNKKYCATCPRIYFPVCGTDDKTYTNECILYCLNRLVPKNVTVKMVRQGPCKLFPGDEVYFK